VGFGERALGERANGDLAVGWHTGSPGAWCNAPEYRSAENESKRCMGQ
jgi:hypothetical protein